MKFKNLFIFLTIILILLFYNLFCYSYAKKIIYRETRSNITNYLQRINLKYTEFEFKDVKTYSNNLISVFIESNNTKYEIIVNNNYEIVKVNKNIPTFR